MIKVETDLFFMVLTYSINELIRISPPLQMFFLFIFENDLSTDFAFCRVPVALYGVCSSFNSAHLNVTVRTLGHLLLGVLFFFFLAAALFILN